MVKLPALSSRIKLWRSFRDMVGRYRPTGTGDGREQPAIAAVAIGRREEPAALPPQPAVSVAAIPQTPPDDSAVPADSAEAPAPAAAPATAPVAPAAKAARSRSRHVARREAHSYSGRSSYSPRYYSNRQVHQAGGYAGLW